MVKKCASRRRDRYGSGGELGVYIPHFCYHNKLSIAANCRMCLVQVEKTPKPMPACANAGVGRHGVHTDSAAAQKAQQSVMEFLLINHPLDCPICDQGGECQLQDLAVGYAARARAITKKKEWSLKKSRAINLHRYDKVHSLHRGVCVLVVKSPVSWS